MRIRGVDPSFDPNGFLDGAEGAFRMIVDAFARGDRQTLRMLLAELRVALRCDMIRRLKDEVFTQLPELVTDLVPVSLDAEQMDAYGAVMDAPEFPLLAG
jgi:SNF2 family DNA or RNA helicase